MRRIAPVPKSHVPQLAAVVCIMLIGFVLRTTDPGAGPLQGDEVWLNYLAYNFGHNGQRAELGVTSSANVNQPPFFGDVMAIPYAFDPDPRIARLFMAILQTVGMAILYFMLRRYWTARIALAGVALYAVLPRAVWAGRFMWNPYLAIPFIIAFLATGFLTTEGRRWARWLHFPLLACVIGSHPILAMTGLIWPLFVLRDWFLHRTRRQRVQVLRDYAVGVGLAVLVLLPWGIGVLHQRLTSAPDQGALVLKGQSALSTVVQFTVGGASILDFGSFLVPNDGTITLPPLLVAACTAIGWLVLLSGLFLIARAAWRMVIDRQVARCYPDLVIGFAYFTPAVFLYFFPARTYDQYFIAIVPCAAAILAIVLIGRPTPHTRPQVGHSAWLNSLRPVRIIALLLILVMDFAYVGQALIEAGNLPSYSQDSMPPLQDVIHLRDAAVRPGIETIYLVDSGSTRAFEQELLWLTLANKGESRVIWGNDFALPVPRNGATYVGYVDSPLIPELYGDRPARIIANNLYKVVDIPSNSGFTPTCQPTGATRLSNGATILGYYVPVSSTAMPQPSKEWTIYVLWTGISNQPHTTFQLFTHLVNDQGTKFAQHDLATLGTDLWRNDDLFVSKVTLAVNAQIPMSQPLYIRVGMYTLPTGTNPNFGSVNAVDSAGASAGGWITIPICERF